MEKELSIEEILWLYLSKGNEAEPLELSQELLESCWEEGIVDAPRVSKKKWQELWKKYWNKEEKHYVFPQSDLSQLAPYLYPDPVKIPFDPDKIADQDQPRSWYLEMYQKVLRFETNLDLSQWMSLLEGPLRRKFFNGKNYRYNSEFKTYIKQLLKQNPSRLRRLECLAQDLSLPQKTDPFEIDQPEEKAPTVLPSQDDAYQNKAGQSQLKDIHKACYEDEGKNPKISDQESLDFLEELADLEEEKNSPLP